MWSLLAGLSGAGLSATGTWMEGDESLEQGKEAKRQAFQEAESIKMSGRDDALNIRHEAEMFKASQIAAISANGGMLTGSALQVVTESAKNYELDALTSERNYMKDAVNMQNRGIMAEQEGKTARTNARIRAIGGLATSAASAYGSYKQNAGGSSGGKNSIGNKKGSKSLRFVKTGQNMWINTTGSFRVKGGWLQEPMS